MPLAEVVASCTYKPGWSIGFVEADEYDGRYVGRLCVVARVLDSRHPAYPLRVEHWMTIPDEPEWTDEEWQRWLLEQLVMVETHEACEFFQIGNTRPFFPEHGLDGDPYAIHRLEHPPVYPSRS